MNVSSISPRVTLGELPPFSPAVKPAAQKTTAQKTTAVKTTEQNTDTAADMHLQHDIMIGGATGVGAAMATAVLGAVFGAGAWIFWPMILLALAGLGIGALVGELTKPKP